MTKLDFVSTRVHFGALLIVVAATETRAFSPSMVCTCLHGRRRLGNTAQIITFKLAQGSQLSDA